MRKEPKIAALILAAGSSARMGTMKALLLLGQSTLLEGTVRGFLAAGIEDVQVVGHKAEEIIPVLARSNVEWILNSNYERGILQAQRLREELRQADLTAVFSSDLKRSFETARIIAEPHRIEVESRVDLREIALGEWEGLPFTEIQQRLPGEFEKRGSDIVHYRPPGGESFLDCAFRIAAVFLEILHATTGDILIVGQAGINRILLREALGKSLWQLFEIRQDYGCLNVFSTDDIVLRADQLNFKVGK